MNAAREFNKAFKKECIKIHYWSKIAYKRSIGLDRISNCKFQQVLDDESKLINRKVTAGNYRFTNYKEVLISKGANKNPRVISIPTVRDQLTLSLCNEALKNTFDYVDFPLVQEIIDDIGKSISEKKFNSFVKLDITNFYPTIDHELLKKKLKSKIRKKEVLNLLICAIQNPTIPANVKSENAIKKTTGVPEGIAISNILANIYLYDLSKKVQKRFDVAFFRYVDDILVLCTSNEACNINSEIVHILLEDYKLQSNKEKNQYGLLTDGVSFLGYEFYNDKISVSKKSILRIEQSLDELFRLSKKIDHDLFVWKLNLRITGCIFDNKKYGWLFFYSQLDDLSILYHLDWLVKQLCNRYSVNTDGVKRFVRTYHEIRKNQHKSNYLINADNYSINDIKRLLSDVYKKPLEELNASDAEIYKMFRILLFKDLNSLERDVQDFS